MALNDDFDIRWSDDGLNAVIRKRDDSFMVRLQVQEWYGDQEVEGQPAWVASWLDPDSTEPDMLTASIERPALTADDQARREHLIGLALAARKSPPETPEPFAIPLPTPAGADEWADHLDLQLDCWDQSFGELTTACSDMEPSGELARYRALTQSLDWAYALDSSLRVLWQALPADVREQVSLRTDEKARRAAEHNERSPLKFDVETDPAFAGYVRRREGGQPYRHWGEVILAGIFQAQFFEAISWARGQLIHAATAAPLEMRQYRPGVAPRWKWRPSDSFARGRKDDPGCKLYDRLFAGHDVVGLLGHLTEVFHDAGMELRRELRDQEPLIDPPPLSSGTRRRFFPFRFPLAHPGAAFGF